MAQSPDSREHISLMLSEVLDNVGVNERKRMTARRNFGLMESLNNITWKSVGYNSISYYLGSNIEGTTTLGLKSDSDEIISSYDRNVIQHLSEWEGGKNNYLMIQDENTTPGYCFLQRLQDDIPLPAIVIPDKSYITYRGKILRTNNVYEPGEDRTQHGPSMFTKGELGLIDVDKVLAFPCKSWPKSASSGWLVRQGIGRWPTQKMKRKTVSTACFVVPTGSKISKYPEWEWRISTTLAERCLMFDLNITQIKCYVLMKMILKSFLNPQGEINISSFMCKTILFHCMEQKEPSIWEENNLLECLKVCLMELKSCVQNDNLSHFIIPENNLIAGQFTAETKHLLLKNISDFIQNDVQSLLRIEIDYLGERLQNFKLNFVQERPYNVLSYLADCKSVIASNCLLSPKDFMQKDLQSLLTLENVNDFYSFLNISETVSASNYSLFFMICLSNHQFYLRVLQNKDIGIMKQIVERLMTYNNNGNELEHAAFTFLAPFIFTTYGSALASESIGLKNQVSPQAMVLLIDGLKSDVLSDRLKLASVFYSTGDIERTELILRHTENQYYSYHLVPICECLRLMPTPLVPAEVHRVCNENNEDCVKKITAFCVRFLKQEINCVPNELQLEMFRSTNDDKKHRNGDEKYWMDWAVVDSLPFLYFLQYKVYRHLQRYQNQQQALTNLANTIETEKDLGHKETALNILGQCMEQENRPKQALKCYLLSLRQRARNNAAKIHIFRLLSSYLDCKAIDKTSNTHTS